MVEAIKTKLILMHTLNVIVAMHQDYSGIGITPIHIHIHWSTLDGFLFIL